MKEKIIEILNRYFDLSAYQRGGTDKSILNASSDEIEQLINLEVEKRIAERMPSDEERHIAASEYEHMDTLTGLYINIDFEEGIYGIFRAGADWACSRLTNPGVNDSQKTEGGGE